MEQTAVEWLIENSHIIPKTRLNKRELIQQANEMFEKQIEDAYMEGAFEKMRHLDGKEFMMPTEYYNTTFKSE